jgi:UDP-N-acetylmuramyl tripeptide synthase
MRLRFYTTLIVAKLAYLAIKILSKTSGTSFVGMLALKLCPNFLKYCSKYINNEIVTITGTNGKSTTSGLIAHILETSHQKVVHNLEGANMLTGVANVFALKVRPFVRFDYAVIESDEAYLTKLYDFMKSDWLVVTNLFRDQLDRYGELNTTAGFIKDAISKNPDLKLILNADDPLVSTFGGNNYSVYYGFENVEYDTSYEHKSNAPSEVFNCNCGQKLEYSKQFFAQEGHYYCPGCGYKRPECDYPASVKVFNDYSIINLDIKGINFEFKVNLAGLYNAYNALAAIAFGLENGLNQTEIQKALDSYHAIFGRTEKRIINGNPVLIQLIKNPTGASEVLKTVDLNSNIVIAINDNYADGRDISWLWDSDFEQLKNAQKMVITSGIRANDMATRLKYAGIPQEKIIVEPNIKHAIEIASKDGKTTLLPSYTALLSISKNKK